jgi:hypothetical protein
MLARTSTPGMAVTMNDTPNTVSSVHVIDSMTVYDGAIVGQFNVLDELSKR